MATHVHTFTIQPITSTGTLSTAGLTVTVDAHNHAITAVQKTIRFGGEPSSGSGDVRFPGPKVTIPGRAGLIPTGARTKMIWRDGILKGFFEDGVTLPNDPDNPVISLTIGVLAQTSEEPAHYHSNSSNSQLIPIL